MPYVVYSLCFLGVRCEVLAVGFVASRRLQSVRECHLSGHIRPVKYEPTNSGKIKPEFWHAAQGFF